MKYVVLVASNSNGHHFFVSLNDNIIFPESVKISDWTRLENTKVVVG